MVVVIVVGPVTVVVGVVVAVVVGRAWFGSCFRHRVSRYFVVAVVVVVGVVGVVVVGRVVAVGTARVRISLLNCGSASGRRQQEEKHLKGEVSM